MVDLEHRITEIDDRSKENARRIERISTRQDALDKLVTSVEVLATREKQVEADVKEIKTDVKSLTDKPAKRWDALVEKIILTVTAAVIGFILAKSGF